MTFTLLAAISGRHGRVGARGHGHGSARVARTHGHARVSTKSGARAGKVARGGAKGTGSKGGVGAAGIPHITFGDFLSPFTVAVFIGAFGLAGLIARKGLRLSESASLDLALPAAMLLAFAVVYVFVKVFLASEGSSIVSLEDCIGTEAQVLVGINSGRIGSIAYVDKGTRLTLPARADDGQVFGKGERVYICRMDGGTAWVQRDRPSLWDSVE